MDQMTSRGCEVKLVDGCYQILKTAFQSRNLKYVNGAKEVGAAAKTQGIDREREIPFNPDSLWRDW